VGLVLTQLAILPILRLLVLVVTAPLVWGALLAHQRMPVMLLVAGPVLHMVAVVVVVPSEMPGAIARLALSALRSIHNE
jgi:hypothetical protein